VPCYLRIAILKLSCLRSRNPLNELATVSASSNSEGCSDSMRARNIRVTCPFAYNQPKGTLSEECPRVPCDRRLGNFSHSAAIDRRDWPVARHLSRGLDYRKLCQLPVRMRHSVGTRGDGSLKNYDPSRLQSPARVKIFRFHGEYLVSDATTSAKLRRLRPPTLRTNRRLRARSPRPTRAGYLAFGADILSACETAKLLMSCRPFTKGFGLDGTGHVLMSAQARSRLSSF